ncbi:uncharacterized protein LOC126841432 isoform X2 [Adelges cooleyi]|uniref:uncharacterized protein LOC126841432 isoform X2 n=1 Tax=Adelges cooleyi TaxID=133065 RepID=UPI00217FB5C8|nr:uncharacterized protein LOC126841432 isoform X2 [Adelges cooleyi]
MTAKEKEVSEEYSNALGDLNINSKPLINMLTMLAEENSAYAPIVVQCIERQLHKVQADSKLPVLYLIDSCIKNIGQPYLGLFLPSIERLFATTFLKVDEKTRANMFKLRSTWNEVLPYRNLYELDVAVHAIDSAWPVGPPPTNIHVNPKFLNNTGKHTEKPAATKAVKDDRILRQELLKKHQELLELQQKKLELELLQTKNELEKQQKKIDKLNTTAKDVPTPYSIASQPSIAKITPVSTQLLQAVRHRDPRLRKAADTTSKPVAAIEDNVKLTFSKKKDDKKLEKPKRDSSKHHDSRKKERSRSRSPVKKELSKKLHKKTEHKEKSPKDDKYHKRRDEKKTKDFDIKKKSLSPSSKVPPIGQLNEPQLSYSPKKDVSAFKKDFQSNNLLDDLKGNVPKAIETPIVDVTNVLPKKIILEQAVNDNLDVKLIQSTPAVSEQAKNDTTVLEDSDSLKRLHMYMQTMKKSPEPSTTAATASSSSCIEPNDKILPVVKSNQNVLIKPQNDIDLRVIAPTTKRTSTDAIKADDNEPAAKKSKSEIIDELFGAEDVDLRTLTAPAVVPSPPPPPQISEAPKQQELGKSWAKYKEIKPDTYKAPYKSPTKKMPGEVSEHHPAADSSQDDAMDVDMRAKPTQSNKSLILRQAEEALNAGSITFDEYKKVMCQVIEMTEVEKLEEVKNAEDTNNALKVKKSKIAHPTPAVANENGTADCLLRANVVVADVLQTADQILERLPSSPVKPTVVENQKNDHRHPTKYEEETAQPASEEPAAKPVDNNNQNCCAADTDEDGVSGCKPMDIDERVNLIKPIPAEHFPVTTTGPWSMVNKKPPTGGADHLSGSESDSCSNKSGGGGGSSESESENSKNVRKSSHTAAADDRPMFNRRTKMFRQKEIVKGVRANWRNNQNKNWNPRPDSGPPPPRFGQQNRIEPWSRGPRPNYCHSSRTLVPLPRYEVPQPTASFASSTPDWTVPVIPPSDPVILDMIARDPTQTINIDGVSREIRFYGPTAITFVSWDDPREIYFQGPPKNVIFDDLFSVLCHFNQNDIEFLLDGQPHRVRLGAPTRELYLDGKFYECFFGGPPVYTELGGVKRSVKLEGPPPSVNIGQEPRKDLVAGRIAVIIDDTYTVPVYLDAKPQRIEVGNTALILRFIDGLMRALINDQPFKVNYNGPPQAITVRGKKHYLRFTGLPQTVKPGYAVIAQMMGVVLTEDTAVDALQPLPAPPMPPNFTGMNIPLSVEDISQPPQSFAPSTYSLVPPTTMPPVNIMPPAVIPQPQLEQPVVNSFSTPPPNVPSSSSVPSILPSNMDINELFMKLVASGIVPKDKPKEVVVSPIIKKKEKEQEDLTVKPVDFSDPSTLKQKQPGLIHNLYTGIQCSSCGIRFTAEYTIKYSSHLDWHFRQNRREKMASKTVQSRKWYYDTSDWCKYEEQEDETTRAASWFDLQAEQGVKEEEKDEEDNVPCVPAGENSELAACYLCHDQFEQFYSEKDEEWQLRNCIDKDKHLYHPMCYNDMIKTREEKIRKRNDAIEEAKRLEIHEMEIKQERQLEKEIKEKLRQEEQLRIKCENEDKLRIKREYQEQVQKEAEELSRLESKPVTRVDAKADQQPSDIKMEYVNENTVDTKTTNGRGDTFDDIDIPENMEVIHSEEVSEDISTTTTTVKQEPNVVGENVNDNDVGVEAEDKTEVVIVKAKSKSPSPVLSTMTCSIDGNTNTEWNVPVAPAMGTIKINISQKASAALKPSSKPNVVETSSSSSVVEVNPQDLTPTFGEIDPDQPPPPGLEMDTVLVVPAKPPQQPQVPPPQRDLKPRIMNNAKKLREYPVVNKGKEMSGLCSIM